MVLVPDSLKDLRRKFVKTRQRTRGLKKILYVIHIIDIRETSIFFVITVSATNFSKNENVLQPERKRFSKPNDQQ